MADEGRDDDLMVIVAHSLLASLDDIERGADTLLARGDDLPSDVRKRSLQLITARAEHVSHVLIDIIRGADPKLVESLDELRRSI